jgi:hypothetical protein
MRSALGSRAGSRAQLRASPPDPPSPATPKAPAPHPRGGLSLALLAVLACTGLAAFTLGVLFNSRNGKLVKSYTDRIRMPRCAAAWLATSSRAVQTSEC